MKILVTGFIILLNLTAIAQSPALTIQVMMDTVKAGSTLYRIEMKICEPKEMTEQGSWFSHDTSAIDFASLKQDDINCGEYFIKGTPELIPGEEPGIPFNQFTYSNQVFAWEKIFVFRISNWSSRAWWPEMYIVMPMKYKSFRTVIGLSGIEFQSGKVIFLDEYNASQKESVLFIDQSLSGIKALDVNDSPLKEVLKK